MGLGRADPTCGPGGSAEEVSPGKPAVPVPSPHESSRHGGVCRVQVMFRTVGEGGGVSAPRPLRCPRAGAAVLRRGAAGQGAAAERAGTAKGLADAPNLFGFVIIEFPAGAQRRAAGRQRDTRGAASGAAGVRLRSSHSDAANSTKITATKATPSPVCFPGLDFGCCRGPGVRGEGRTGGSEQLSVNRHLRGGGRGSSRPARPPVIRCRARLLHRRVLSTPVVGSCARAHACARAHVPALWPDRSPGRYRGGRSSPCPPCV